MVTKKGPAPPVPEKTPLPKMKVSPGTITGFDSSKTESRVKDSPDGKRKLQVIAFWSIPPPVEGLPPTPKQSAPENTDLGSVKKTSDGRFSRSYTIKNLPSVLQIGVQAQSADGLHTGKSEELVSLTKTEGKAGVNISLDS